MEERIRYSSDNYSKTSTSPRWNFPPGWRGYGAKNYIDNPETLFVRNKVDEIRAKPGIRRRRPLRCPECTDAVPALLPENLRGKNERIDEPRLNLWS